MESRHLVTASPSATARSAVAWGDPASSSSSLRGEAPPGTPLVPFGLPEDELAIACASHEALPEQLVAVRALLERAGAATEDLECGAEHGSKLRHNCSGKHAGFLLLARQNGWPTEGYRLPEHPVQQGVRQIVAAAAGKDAAELETAVDGCGVPTFALSLVGWPASSPASSAGSPRARTPSCGP